MSLRFCREPQLRGLLIKHIHYEKVWVAFLSGGDCWKNSIGKLLFKKMAG